MINIRYEGDFFINHSLAIVNREICLELTKNPEINLSIKSNRENVLTEIELSRFKPLMDIVDKKQEKVDFTIRHQWPPNFSIPEKGKLIIMQPWEFGSIPESWLEPFITIPDQIWAISNFNKNVYIKDGIPQEKVKTVHLGVREDLYQNDISPLNIKTNKKFKFLFNGGTIHRKGIDLLLKAYTQEFSTNEDVTLNIKDIGTKNI
ncbi:MAG: hypothetical protein H7263_08105 [Candidatus Sericytochromatia bacterium]|nr:hypothetical protein [Candidatus Sericytochromatia bacterium]